MSKIVLDSSALLACLNGEPGGDAVTDQLAEALMSSVNLAEAVGVLVRRGASLERAREILGLLQFTVADFDRPLAEQTGAFVKHTTFRGLSIGDRACLALASRENLPVLTADRAWNDIDVGVEVRLIRE
jgi:ribonuclease VapC